MPFSLKLPYDLNLIPILILCSSRGVNEQEIPIIFWEQSIMREYFAISSVEIHYKPMLIKITTSAANYRQISDTN